MLAPHRQDDITLLVGSPCKHLYTIYYTLYLICLYYMIYHTFTTILYTIGHVMAIPCVEPIFHSIVLLTSTWNTAVVVSSISINLVYP